MAYNFDPELAPIVDMLPLSSFEDPVAARAGLDEMIASLSGDLDTSGVIIENAVISGAVDVPIRIFRPENLQQPTAGLLHIHGGGFAVGSLDSEQGTAIALCQQLGIVIVSVGYRLAPENPYPAGLEDCYTALQWTFDNAPTLHIDCERLGILGQSAGGGLAASLALLLKERNGPRICFQFLGIPELDDRLETVSMKEFVDTPLWSRPNAEYSWQYYLGETYQPGGENVPITAAPARATIEQLRGLPPACVTTMEFDPLRDEGIEYALKLMQAGISVDLHNYPGTFHGSAMIAGAAISKRQNQDMLAILRWGLKL